MEEANHYIVLEISNFQLLNIDKFRPKIATILNLTPDHIDFMGSLVLLLFKNFNLQKYDCR